MSEPGDVVDALIAARWPGASVRSLAGDASTRRFVRVTPPDAPPIVLMVRGEPFDGETDDIRMARIFRTAGLPVADVLEVHASEGIIVLEDLGDATLESALASVPRDGRLPGMLRAAIDLARRVASVGTSVLASSPRAAGPALDGARFRFEMDFFVDHWVGDLLGRDEDTRDRLAAPLHELADRAAQGPKVLCHRDFHSRNLMLRADGSPTMVDIQDARWGPDTYDLASLLRDAYIDLPERWVDEGISVFLAGFLSRVDADAFRARFDVVSVQRMLKALGTFGYQAACRGAGRYLEGAPRTVERLRRVLPSIEQGGALLVALDAAGALEPPRE